MTREEIADAIASRISDWPADALNELFETMGRIELAHGLSYEPGPAEIAGIERGLADAEAGRFASEDEVVAVFAAFRG